MAPCRCPNAKYHATSFDGRLRAVISNARCLTEGVDVPSVDMVAFLTPKRSRVDIVQATGRAMRKAPGKTTGYVSRPALRRAGERRNHRGSSRPYRVR